jgi:hypothetical protein
MDSDDEEEQMFAEIFEEEMAAAAQDEEHMLILLACRACTRRRPLVAVVGRHQVAGSASRGREWRAIAYCTPTTLPTIHCTVRLFLGVVSG